MYGQIHRFFSHPGRRDELVRHLSATSLHDGCLSLVVAEDTGDPDGVWITEVWRDEAAYRASLDREEVVATVAHVIALVARFEAPARTRPVLTLP